MSGNYLQLKTTLELEGLYRHALYKEFASKIISNYINNGHAEKFHLTNVAGRELAISISRVLSEILDEVIEHDELETVYFSN